MYIVKRCRRLADFAKSRMNTILASYGDGDVQKKKFAEWTKKYGLVEEGSYWRGFPQPWQIVSEDHDDTGGGVPNVDDITLDQLHSAITHLVTVEHIPAGRIAGWINNASSLSVKMDKDIREKQKHEALPDISPMIAAAMANPTVMQEWQAAVTAGEVSETWIRSWYAGRDA